MRGRAVAAVGMVLIVVVAAACGGSDGGGTAGPQDPAVTSTQKDDGGSVDVEATWVTPDHLATDEKLRAAASEYDGDDVFLLHVSMNTHSGDLSGYDLGVLTSLDDGRVSQRPLGWSKVSDDSHHTEALLAFKRPDDAAALTLVMADLGGVSERRLTWEVE